MDGDFEWNQTLHEYQRRSPLRCDESEALGYIRRLEQFFIR
jgi:hypothetical protein